MSEELLEKLRENLPISENLYDLMAYFFLSITKLYTNNISNLILFVETNINAKSLSDSFNELLSNDNSQSVLSPQVFGKFLDLIENASKENEVVEKSDNKLLPGLCLVLLQNIDTWFSNKDLSYFNPTYGPLNTQLLDECCIYFRGNESHHKEKSESFEKDRIHSFTINNLFDNFIIIRKVELPSGCGIPKIAHISRTRTETLSGVNCTCFPWGNNLNFAFIERDRYITVDYQTEDKDYTKNRISGFISKAIIETDPNIIIFPEYSISPFGLEEIKDLVKKIRFQSQSFNLDFIVAGSTWQKTGSGIKEKDNNVMTILDNHGNEIGTYFKYSPFIKKTEVNGLMSIERHEKLDDPGKEITLIHLDHIGIVLPSLCRDTYDGAITNTLAELFLPAYVLTTAYSHSLSSFKGRFQDLAQRFHINFIFCNYCESIEENGSEIQDIGFAGSAEKQKTVVSCSEECFQRDKLCFAQCKSKACYFNVNFNWQEDSGDIIKLQKYFFELNL